MQLPHFRETVSLSESLAQLISYDTHNTVKQLLRLFNLRIMFLFILCVFSLFLLLSPVTFGTGMNTATVKQTSWECSITGHTHGTYLVIGMNKI